MSAEDVRRWDRLSAAAAEPNPVFESLCLRPAATFLPGGNDIKLVVAEEDGEFFGCFPVVRKSSFRRPSYSFRGFCRPTWTTQVRRNRYDGTPLVRPERADEAFVAMLSVLGSQGSDGAGTVVFEYLSADGPVLGALRSAIDHLGVISNDWNSYGRPIVRRRSDGGYLDAYSGKFLRELRRRERALGDQLGGAVELVDRSHDPNAIDEYLAMEVRGYKGTTTERRGDGATGRGGAFSCWDGEPEWLKAMCDGARSDGRLLVPTLSAAGTTVAMDIMVRSQQGVFGIGRAYDERFARNSPGNNLAIKVIDRFHTDTDAEWIDTCTYPNNTAMERLYPDRHEVATLVLALSSPADRVALTLAPVVRKFKARISAVR